MARSSTTRYAVLGMLTLGPMTGYALRETIAGTIGHFWHESFGQLYPTLAALERDGLVASRAARTGRGREHTLTPAGYDALRTWLAQAPATSSSHRSELLLKVFFGRHAEPGTVERHLEMHRGALTESRAYLADLEAQVADDPAPDQAYWLATVRHGIHLTDASLAWTSETLASLTPETAP
ncbi:hypothetical protein GCM10011331_09890 [Flavimobilis marinus]|uniref:Transcriptional regulator, PadR family n=1 Tax=Flavimobilis marinus TaxID=285351 RepID=A0A1I2I0W6_9MICO|nr:PadR family transcriptional regulator [Flavimobilis marinus]GHG48268.1 hypothetical protein GCM10011331_09890 [Flavimobilis marinus]SFF35250.1 transcriptional regulator, PadR family [Flavimobilis marinus]